MANNYRPFIPSRAKDGRPMTYAIVAEDGSSTPVTKAELIASFDDLHPVYVNAEAGIAVRLPLSDESEVIADENRRFIETEAKHEQRWAARTVELDKPTASGAPLEVADKFDLARLLKMPSCWPRSWIGLTK